MKFEGRITQFGSAEGKEGFVWTVTIKTPMSAINGGDIQDIAGEVVFVTFEPMQGKLELYAKLAADKAADKAAIAHSKTANSATLDTKGKTKPPEKKSSKTKEPASKSDSDPKVVTSLTMTETLAESYGAEIAYSLAKFDDDLWRCGYSIGVARGENGKSFSDVMGVDSFNPGFKTARETLQHAHSRVKGKMTIIFDNAEKKVPKTPLGQLVAAVVVTALKNQRIPSDEEINGLIAQQTEEVLP